MWQRFDIIVHKGNVRRIHRNVAAHTAHGDAHMRLFQCGRIVYAVPYHANRDKPVRKLRLPTPAVYCELLF